LDKILNLEERCTRRCELCAERSDGERDTAILLPYTVDSLRSGETTCYSMRLCILISVVASRDAQMQRCKDAKIALTTVAEMAKASMLDLKF
jgi:hypothetical protein